MPNATHGRIMFQKDTSVGQDLFLDPLNDQWSLWHETGHTYQAPQYRWNGLTEVTNNITVSYVQQKLGFRLKLFTENNKRESIKEYLSMPNEKKDFNHITQGGEDGVWVKLGMFLQLYMAFGDNFYPLLNQTYRKISSEENWEGRFNTDNQKIQEFIKIISQPTGYNLEPFFTNWGLQADEETVDSIKHYKKLTKPIWNNIVEAATEHNPIVQKKL